MKELSLLLQQIQSMQEEDRRSMTWESVSSLFALLDSTIYDLSPSRILNTTLFESWEIIGPYPSWWLFNGLLLILQMLHVIWSYLIVRTALKALIRGKVRVKLLLCLEHIGAWALLYRTPPSLGASATRTSMMACVSL